MPETSDTKNSAAAGAGAHARGSRLTAHMHRARRGLKRMHVRLRELLLLTGNLGGSGIQSHSRDGRSALVDRFAGVLSTLYWEPQAQVFVLSNGGQTEPCALGAVFELNALIWADAATVQGIERIFASAYPRGTVIAVTLFASSAVQGTLREYVESRRRVLEERMAPGAGEEALRAAAARTIPLRMARERARMLEAMARQTTAPGALAQDLADKGCVREFRVWMTVTARLGEGAVRDFLSGAHCPQVESFLLSVRAVESALMQLSLFKRRWDAHEFTRTMREIVNPQHQRALGPGLDTVPSVPLREGLVRRDTMMDVAKNKITFASAAAGAGQAVEAATLTVAGYPASAHLNRMRSALAQADFTYPYLLTCAVEPTPVADDRALIAMKNARVKQLMHTEIGQFLTDLPERSRDFDLAQRACEEGSGLARVLHAMTVFAPAGESMAAAAKAGNVLARAGMDAQLACGLQMMGLLFNLPLEAGHGLMQDARAARQTSTKTRRAAAHLSPLMAESRGSGARPGAGREAGQARGRSPMLMLVTRRGQLLPIDIFANRNGNFNAVVAGTSGSGKSVLVQEIVLSQIGLGGRVWVFDIGKSYKNCVELVDGQFIDFDRAAGRGENRRPLCLNPLDMLDDPSEMLDELAQIVTVMANGDAPMELTQAELLKLYIDRVVRESRAAGVVPTITRLAMSLMKAQDAGLGDIAVRLMPYCAGGRYAHWFEGEASIDFESELVVLEMEALANKPVLQNAVLLIVIMRILKEIRLRPRSEKKLIVIDEAWRLLAGNTGRFIEWACRTLRKYGAGIVCISQSMSDFDATPAARAVRQNADSVFLLRQKPAGIAAYTDNPALASLLSSLTTRAGAWSEVYVKVGDQAGVAARLMLDSFSMTAYSTRAEVFEAVQKARARGLSIEEAVVAVSRMQLEGD